ncbi:MAG: glycosyltransferase [Ignavibacteria bacterium]|nr:glycosyltransferase [Ignavibacteria bacterium]
MSAPSASAVLVLVFSKDRALQCDAVLRSFRLHCADASAAAVTVLYACSGARHERMYEILANEWRHESWLRFRREKDFRADVRALLAERPFILFVVDDTLFVRPFSLEGTARALASHAQALGFSLRLGRNTRYCYMSGEMQPLPRFRSAGPGCLLFRWDGARHDFGYPLEVSSSMYRSDTIRAIVETAGYRDPTSLEGALERAASRAARRTPELLCLEHSVAFSNPVNTVLAAGTNRVGRASEYASDALAEAFEAAHRIDAAAYGGMIPNACHQELPLRFLPSAGAPPAPDPRVSVVMPARNAAPFLAESVASILAQTMSDFEFIIVEDASTDESAAVLASFRDPRLRILRNDRPRGQTVSFNIGAGQARGEYLARMDADDIADPQRFMKQAALLDAQPATGVCGSWVRLVGDGPQMLVRYPRTHEGVAAGMLFRTQVANPSVMMRTALFREQGGFNPDYNQAEDYEFWSASSSMRASRFFRRRCCSIARIPRRWAACMPRNSGSARRKFRRRCSENSASNLPRKSARCINRWDGTDGRPRGSISPASTRGCAACATRTRAPGSSMRGRWTTRSARCGFPSAPMPPRSGSRHGASGAPRHWARCAPAGEARPLPRQCGAEEAQMSAPLVSVLMPVRNARPYLAEAVRAVLGQTEQDFELLVCDDASEDGSMEVVEAFRDPRIRMLRGPETPGVVGAVNTCIDAARGEFLANMDADDRMHPRRLEKQIRTLRAHREIGVCGTWMTSFGPGGAVLTPPERHEEIVCDLLFHPSPINGTAMFRASLRDETDLHWRRDYPRAEDYDWLLRLSA